MKKHNLLPLLAVVLLLAASCSTHNTQLPYFQDLTTESGTLPEIEYMPAIQPDDELQITVTSSDPAATAMYNLPEINAATRQAIQMNSSPRMLTYVVGTDGCIDFPQLGRVEVASKNVEQVQQELTRLISRTVTDPQVSVVMANFTVVVAGEVKNPQTIRVPRNRFTILEALSAAGDMTEYGERSNLLLIRENNGQREFTRINLNESDVLSSPYYYLQPNDYIYVSPNKVRQENSKYNQNNGFKLSVISTAVSAASVIASLVIALTVK